MTIITATIQAAIDKISQLSSDVLFPILHDIEMLEREDAAAAADLRSALTKKLNADRSATTITSTTSTTSTTNQEEFRRVILEKHWGMYDPVEDLIIEQINTYTYAMRWKNTKALLKVHSKTTRPEGSKKSRLVYYLPHNETHFILPGKPQKPWYTCPSYEQCQEWVMGKRESLSGSQVFNRTVKALNVLFDFTQPLLQPQMFALTIGASWNIHRLSASWFVGIDASKGSGKSSLLEAGDILCRHGLFAGNVSAAAIPRLKDSYDLTLLYDEIDELSQHTHDDVVGMIRKGQRRGSRYIRVNKNTLAVESFDAFGFYFFAYRKSLEDALQQRTLPLSMAVSADKRLPIINYQKQALLQDLQADWFFYYMDLATTNEREVVDVVEVTGFRDTVVYSDVDKYRQYLYDSFTEGFTDNEKNALSNVVGRNVELSYLCLITAKYLEVDLSKVISEVFSQKQSSEDIPDSYYLERLSQYILELKEQFDDWKLERGDYADCFYYPKNLLYTQFVQLLRGDGVMTIGTSKFAGLLRDIGFVNGDTIRNQRHKGTNIPTQCVVVSEKILKSLSKGDYEDSDDD